MALMLVNTLEDISYRVLIGVLVESLIALRSTSPIWFLKIKPIMVVCGML